MVYANHKNIFTTKIPRFTVHIWLKVVSTYSIYSNIIIQHIVCLGSHPVGSFITETELFVINLNVYNLDQGIYVI